MNLCLGICCSRTSQRNAPNSSLDTLIIRQYTARVPTKEAGTSMHEAGYLEMAGRIAATTWSIALRCSTIQACKWPESIQTLTNTQCVEETGALSKAWLGLIKALGRNTSPSDEVGLRLVGGPRIRCLSGRILA